MSLLENRPLVMAAARYAERGWAVFPCKVRGKVPLTRHGVKDATTNPDQCYQWWQPSRFYTANVGIATGQASGLYVIDCDGQEGIDQWAGLTLVYGDAPTLMCRTGGGGLHLYYSIPSTLELRNTAKRIGAGIDSRGDGGYVLAPPSWHESGRQYAWLNALTPAPLPDWVVQRVRLAEPAVAAPRPSAPAYRAEANDSAAVRVLAEECAAIARLQPGNRNDSLFTAALKMGTLVGGGDLRADDVYLDLLAAAQACGLSAAEAKRTIESGMQVGIPSPRTIRTRQKGMA